MENQYKEALKPLLEKKKVLEKELHDLNTIISTLTALVGVTNELPFAKFRAVKKSNTRSSGKAATTYNSQLKHPAKIVYVLKKVGAATVTEIVDYICSIDKSADRKKLLKGITYAASTLYKNQELFAQRVGKANKYSLTDFNGSNKNDTNKQEEAA